MHSMHMLIGQISARVDEKFRVAFPKQFRETIGKKIVVTQGFEGSLILVAESNWKALLEGTEGKTFIDGGVRDLQRYLLGCASSVELDEKGRILLPQYLRMFAQIETDVIFLGISRYIELWDRKRWDVYHTGLTKRIESVTEKLSRNNGNE